VLVAAAVAAAAALLLLLLSHARLYETWGFAATPWVDPVWQEDAEKGRAVRQRRIMLIKPLTGHSISPPHLRDRL
jgi:hypothetical protein